MSIARDQAIVNINLALQKIREIKKKLEQKNDELPGFKDLQEQFKKIYDLVGKRQTNLKNDIKELQDIIDTIKKNKTELLKEKTQVMVEVIRANLPNDMTMISHDNNCTVCELLYKNKKIGEIEIKQNDDNLNISVQVNDSDYETFIIDDELGMYTVINYIITKFNYD